MDLFVSWVLSGFVLLGVWKATELVVSLSELLRGRATPSDRRPAILTPTNSTQFVLVHRAFERTYPNICLLPSDILRFPGATEWSFSADNIRHWRKQKESPESFQIFKLSCEEVPCK